MDRAEFRDLTDVLSSAIRESKRLLGRFKVVPRTRRHKRFVMIVLNDLIRKCESVEAMARTSTYSGINIVTRAAFESYADLLNLFKHKDHYPDYMIYVSFNQQRSFLQAMDTDVESSFTKALESDFSSSLGESSDEMLTSTLQQMKDIERDLPSTFKNSKGKVITLEIFKFQLAGKSKEYNVLYRHLSASTHGRLSAMLAGVMAGERMEWPPSEPTTRPLVAIDSLCAIIIESSVLTAQKFRKPHAPFGIIANQQKSIRNAYLSRRRGNIPG